MVGLNTAVRLVSAFALMASCALPEGTGSEPSDAYYRWLAAAKAGDTDVLWRMVPKTTRASFESWVKAERETAALIPTAYSGKDQEAARKKLHAARYKDGKALYMAIFSKPGSELGLLARLGARVRSVETTETGATITTWAGNRIVLRADGSGGHTIDLPAAQSKRIQRYLEQARVNLHAIRKRIQTLKKLRWPKP